MMTENNDEPEDPVILEIDGELDLHTFSPRDLKTLIPDYLAECRKKGIREVRIVHGKGTGSLRRSVHSLLESNSLVRHYRLAGNDSGSWGATIVILAD